MGGVSRLFQLQQQAADALLYRQRCEHIANMCGSVAVKVRRQLPGGSILRSSGDSVLFGCVGATRARSNPVKTGQDHLVPAPNQSKRSHFTASCRG